MEPTHQPKNYYAFYFDGACEPRNPKGNLGIGAFILNPERKRIFELSQYVSAKDLNFATSNNVAEYMGVIAGMKFLIEKNLHQENIICCGDSKMVICQMLGEWGCNGGIYSKYYYEAIEIKKQFKNINFIWIPREKNSICDELSKRAMIANKCEFRIQPLK